MTTKPSVPLIPVRNIISMLSKWRKKPTAPEKRSGLQTFDRYVAAMPSLQNAIDAIPGWSTAFPPEFGLKAGALATYSDCRIQWAIERFGSLENRDVLELGPLEGGHTSMIEAAGARVDAIEANQLAFMRCLVTKEIMGLTRSRFWLGDFIKWLENTDKTYDLVVASGVLYHLTSPLELIDLIARRTSAVFIWTHVVTEEAMPLSDPRRIVFAPHAEEIPFHGITVRAYRRNYFQAQVDPAFCGGMNDEHRWLHRDDLLEALKVVGFTNIQTTHEEPDHRFGPALSIFASK